jgi:hypothetical protein
MDWWADLLRMNEELDMLPPRPRYFIARHDVPYGRVFKMWDTRGQMHAYINRGQVHDMAVTDYRETPVFRRDLLRPQGIPVFLE